MKKLQRRRFLQLAAAATFMPAVIARADTYPSRSVRIVVGFPPGSATDTDMRLIAAPLGQKLGQEFIVDNRPAPAATSLPKLFRARSPTATCCWR